MTPSTATEPTQSDASAAATLLKAKKRARMFKLLKPHRRQLILGLIAIAGESIANLLDPWPLKILIDHIGKDLSKHPKPGSGLVNALVHKTAGTDPYRLLIFLCVAVMLIALLDAICSYAEKVLTLNVGQWVTHDLRKMLYSQMQKLPLAYHDQTHTGELISRVTGDIDSIQSFIMNGLLGSLVDVVTLIGMVGVMFYVNWKFTLIALAVVPLLFSVTYTFTRRIKKASRDVRVRESKMLSVIGEVLGSIRVVKAFAREDYEVERLEKESLETVDTALAARSLKAKLTPIVDVVVAVGTCGVLYFGGRMAFNGEIEAGSIVLFMAYLKQMYKPMQDLSKMMDTFSKAAIGYERIEEVLDNGAEMKDAKGAKKAPKFRGDIEFDHVSFGYDPSRLILNDVCFEISAGQTVAVVGPTGSGKTTIINMIPRFYDPTNGQVKIDGTDVRKFKQRSLREQISFVLQDTVLFQGTIWENIAYGRPEATREEIERASQIANATEFIEKMEGGYNAKVGERGVTLSGGQRQRIAIARAVLRNSPILILDEPTSGLDAHSEALVVEALERLMEGKTSIVIAHRLSTIRKADMIIVVKDGRVVEQGSRDELLEKEDGVFRALHSVQLEHEVMEGSV